MDNLYNKIYEAIDNGIQKALIITDDQSSDSSVRFHNKEITTDFISYECRFVDLGLSVLWAEYNLGAMPSQRPKDWYGDYYAWGETLPKSDYSMSNYKYYRIIGNKPELTKYNIKNKYGNADHIVSAEPEDDVVYMTLGNPYRMPTIKEFNELIDNTVHEWVTDYNNVIGLNGMLFTSDKNGKKIFLPAAGYYSGNNRFLAGDAGCMWSGSDNTNYFNGALRMYFDSDKADTSYYTHSNGFTVRAVKEKEIN